MLKLIVAAVSIRSYTIFCILCYYDDALPAQDKTEHGREESFKLLQGELEKLKNKKMERAQVLKSHQAIVVLQARQVLASLLARWPAGASKLSSTFLGCKDITEYFSLLDILLREQKPDTCKKVYVCLYVCMHGVCM